MNVTCPNCATVYRVDPAKVPAAGVRARCNVCSAVFAVRREGLAEPVRPAVAAQGSSESKAAVPKPEAPKAAPKPEPAKPEPPKAPAQPEPARPAQPVAARPMVSTGSGSAPAAPPAARPAMPPRPAAPANPAASAPSSPAPTATGSGSAAAPPAAPRAATPMAPPAPAAPKPPAAPATPAAAPAPARPSQPPSPGARPPNPFLSQDPALKARRLARALISDMVVYHPGKRQEGLRDGNLKSLFEEEIKKSWEEYAEQVGREVADSTPYFREALNEILAGGRQIF